MTRQLFTLWSEHDAARRQILGALTRSLDIFDEDLSRLGLEQPESIEILRSFLLADTENTMRIVVKNPEPFRRESPRLFNLFETFTQRMSVIACPEHLLSLNDSMFIVDRRHALIRFHQDNARCKAIIDDIDECHPYVNRFAEIVAEGGEQISATTLGL